jgi:hypothetical protein
LARFAPPDEALLDAATARLTRAFLTADEEAIREFVTERRALREELAELRASGATLAGVVSLERRERQL